MVGGYQCIVGANSYSFKVNIQWVPFVVISLHIVLVNQQVIVIVQLLLIMYLILKNTRLFKIILHGNIFGFLILRFGQWCDHSSFPLLLPLNYSVYILRGLQLSTKKGVASACDPLVTLSIAGQKQKSKVCFVFHICCHMLMSAPYDTPYS
jgi:hypothetical protein